MTVKREFEIAGRDFSNAGKVSTQIKDMLRTVGYSSDVIRRLAIAAYEAEMNVVMYAHTGHLTIDLDPQRVRVVLEDAGPGIADIEQAMQPGFSTATEELRQLGFGAGMGLPNIRRNTDEFDISSRVGEGTRLEFAVRTDGSEEQV